MYPHRQGTADLIALLGTSTGRVTTTSATTTASTFDGSIGAVTRDVAGLAALFEYISQVYQDDITSTYLVTSLILRTLGAVARKMALLNQQTNLYQ